jgi:hypothetical protein
MANWDSDAYLSDVPPMHVGSYYDEDYEDNGDDYYYDDEYSDDLPLSELFDQCILPTLSQTMEQVYPLLVFSLVMRITGHFILTGLLRKLIKLTLIRLVDNDNQL